MTSSGGWKPKPASGKHSENMTVRKQDDIAFYRADPRNRAIDPRADLFRAFSAAAAVAKKHPAGRLCADLLVVSPSYAP
jgi:hypothetical protein